VSFASVLDIPKCKPKTLNIGFSNRTSIDMPLLLSIVSVSALLLSDLYVSFYFLSQLEVLYAVFQLGLISLETDG
jgi:hypothetical protein